MRGVACDCLRLVCRGTVIHNIELTPGRGGQLVRAAGASAQLIGQVDRYSQVSRAENESSPVLHILAQFVSSLVMEMQYRHLDCLPCNRGSALALILLEMMVWGV